MSHNDSLMKTAVRCNVFPNVVHMTCTAHALSFILEEWPRQVDSLNSTVAPMKRLYCQSTLNFSSEDFINLGMSKLFAWATRSNRSHTIGANYLYISLNANSVSLL